MSARVASLNVGLPRSLEHRGRSVRSGIFKFPIRGALWMGETGFEGDAQADTEHHGGPDKAVCVYATEHLPYWRERLGLGLEPGAFGENVSTEGLVETEVRIGDVYEVGEAVAQVSQPRSPCFKLAARHGEKELASWVKETGFTGFYLRCLKPGEVRAGDEFVRVEEAEHGLTVSEANRVMHGDGGDVEGIERLLATPELSAEWKNMLKTRLQKRARKGEVSRQAEAPKTAKGGALTGRDRRE